MSKRGILLLIAAVVVAFLGIRWTIHQLVSDETKITWLIEGMVEGFDEGKAGDAVEGLAEDWRHESSSVDRDLLRSALAREILSRRQSSAKEWPYRVEVPEDLLRITVDGDEAEVECEAIFHRRHQEEWRSVWRMEVRAELVRGDDGWRFQYSRHEDLEGRGLR